MVKKCSKRVIFTSNYKFIRACLEELLDDGHF